ncbi:MAG: SDR family oxidoreductase [Planctomycetaceae bacterium]|nr:MAG: SDR family oxidoreductase [Planctomycetaceae bacterium]
MSKKQVRTIVLTGVTRGLGRAMCDRLIEAGHTVLGCGRSVAEITALKKKFPKPHDFTPVDVSLDEQVTTWGERLLAEYGPPDLLINNAAVINRNAPLWKIPTDEFRKVIEANIIGVTNCIRCFVPGMVARKHGVIVNFSSGWGRSVAAEVAPYCATKWAIEGLTQALALELPKGMAAIPLNPGVINTDMLQSCFGKSSKSYPGADAWSRLAVPFLLSLGAEHNGASLNIE